MSTVTTAVTWVRVGESEPGPARLALSMGPMPQAERLTFEVVQTYADGTVVRWADAAGAHRAPVLTLLPAAAGAAGSGRARRSRRPGGRRPGRCATAVRTPRRRGDRPTGRRRRAGNADGMLAAGLLAGLGGGAAIGWLVSRWRRRDPAEAAALAEVTGDPDETATLAEITGRAGRRNARPDAPTPCWPR